MFDRDGIKNYVGNNSGNSYGSGLANIERKYSPVDIDSEYEKDECATLLSTLEKAKYEAGIEPKEKSQRQDNYSHLKKYIYFKRYKRFIAWLSEQPQRNDPKKRYAPQTVKAAADCIRKGLSSLPVFTYKETDCFSITEPDEFKKVYDRCYDAAEDYDKKKGFGDFRNGLDFYYAYLKGGNHEVVNPMTSKIRDIIFKYKADFDHINQEERYKWEAVGCYQRNWDIEAEDFAQMYADAFKEANNLLAANRYWPYKMVITFAKQKPEKVRELFKMLYNEETPLAKRISDFRAAFDEFYKPQDLQHYQDLHAISVYLSFEYPDKYYIYKYNVFKDFSRNIGFVTDHSKPQSEANKLDAYFGMCDLVLDEVLKDTELKEMSATRLDEKCYDDLCLHLLTFDVIYFGSKTPLANEISAEYEEDAYCGDEWPLVRR